MQIKIRTTHAFADISVDEIQTTIFSSDKKEVKDFITNLIDVAFQMERYSDVSVSDIIKEMTE